MIYQSQTSSLYTLNFSEFPRNLASTVLLAVSEETLAITLTAAKLEKDRHTNCSIYNNTIQKAEQY